MNTELNVPKRTTPSSSRRVDEVYSNDSGESDWSKSHDIFELIGDRQWEAVAQFLQECPQAARRRHRIPHSIQCNLPLHEVCRHEPPLHVVNLLLDLYDEAIHTPGRYGFLPLHIACGTGASYDVVVRLLDAYPAATRCRDDVKDSLPLHLAAQWGASEEVLMEILTTHPEGSFIRDASGKSPLDHANALPDGQTKKYAIAALETAPILVATAKSAACRVEQEMESRLRGIQDAHKEFIRQLEERHEDERAEFLRLEIEFHNELASEKERNCELAEMIVSLQKRELHESESRDALKKQLEEQRSNHQRRSDELQMELKTVLDSVSDDESRCSGHESSHEKKEGEEKDEVSRATDAVATHSSHDSSSRFDVVNEVSHVVSRFAKAKADLEKVSKELHYRDDMVHHLNELLHKKDNEILSLTSQLQKAETVAKAAQEELLKNGSLHKSTLQELNSTKNEMNRLQRRSETQLQQLQESRRMLQVHGSRMGNIKSLVGSLSYHIDSWTLEIEQSQLQSLSQDKAKGDTATMEKDGGNTSSIPNNDREDQSSAVTESTQRIFDSMERVQNISNITFDPSGETSSWNEYNQHDEEMHISREEYGNCEDVGLEVTVLKSKGSWDKSTGESNDTAMTTKAPDYEGDEEELSTLSQHSSPATGTGAIRPIDSDNTETTY